jgi:hypothetical protein
MNDRPKLLIWERRPRQFFLELSAFLQFSYHHFDRIIMNRYLSLLSRENQVTYFFREGNGVPKLTHEVLR